MRRRPSLADSSHQRLADVLVGYSTRVAQGELVLIEAPDIAAPLARELYRSVLRAGAHPLVRVRLDGLSEQLLFHASDAQLDHVNPTRVHEMETIDVRIVVFAAWNTKSLTSVDPARQARATKAVQGLQARALERAARGELRWVVAAYPSHASAQDAEMSLLEYERFVYGAGMLDRPDPVAEWRRFGEELERIARFLGAKRELRVVGDGTDLTVGVEGRSWVAGSGQENFPDGEIFTGPVETKVEGTIRFTYPAVFGAREVEDVRLRFERGEVVEATAGRGEDFLREMIGLDDGSRRVGEFAFGLNESVQEFTRNTLFDEKIGGTVHLALGAAYPETGSRNTSALHWDMICDLRSGSEVYADGELVYRDGTFLELA